MVKNDKKHCTKDFWMCYPFPLKLYMNAKTLLQSVHSSTTTLYRNLVPYQRSPSFQGWRTRTYKHKYQYIFYFDEQSVTNAPSLEVRNEKKNRFKPCTHPSGNADANNSDTEIFDQTHFVKYGDFAIWLTARDQNYNVWYVWSISVKPVEYPCPGKPQCFGHVRATAQIYKISYGVGQWRNVVVIVQVKLNSRCSTWKQVLRRYWKTTPAMTTN